MSNEATERAQADENMAAAISSTEAWLTQHFQETASHHRAKAAEIAQTLPADRLRAQAIIDDALRIHAAIHDDSASAVSRDLKRQIGE